MTKSQLIHRVKTIQAQLGRAIKDLPQGDIYSCSDIVYINLDEALDSLHDLVNDIKKEYYHRW